MIWLGFIQRQHWHFIQRPFICRYEVESDAVTTFFHIYIYIQSLFKYRVYCRDRILYSGHLYKDLYTKVIYIKRLFICRGSISHRGNILQKSYSTDAEARQLRCIALSIFHKTWHDNMTSFFVPMWSRVGKIKKILQNFPF